MKTKMINIARKIIVLIIPFCIQGVTYSQSNASCSDTFLRKKIVFNHDSIGIVNFKLTRDNNFLFTGNIYNEYGRGLIGEISNQGVVTYAKKIIAPTNLNKSAVFTVAESNNNIYWAGAYYENENGVYIIKTDLLGNIINSFFYPVKYEYRTSEIVVYSIKYISDNEIYILSNAEMGSTGGTTSYNLLIRMDSSGNILWSKAFNTGGGINTNATAYDMYKKGNDLYLSGVVAKQNDLNTCRIFIMKLNITTGDTLSLHTWVTNNFAFYNGQYNSEYSLKINEVNGSFFLTMGSVFSPSFFENYFAAAKIGLDNNMDIKESVQVKANTSSLNTFFTSAAMNDSGDFCSLFTQQADLILCVLSKNNILQTQRKITQLNSWPLGNFANSGLNINRVGIIYNFSQHFNPSLNEYELIKINPKKVSNNRCLGVDTSFARIETLSFEPASFNWDSVTNNIVSFRQINLTTANITDTEEMICYEAYTCDNLKIKGNNHFCLNNAVTTFTVKKNPSCLQKIFWDIDSGFAKIIQHKGDTSVTVEFIKPFHGYIKCSYETCTMSDSIFIDVYEQKSKVNFGNDRKLCPNENNTLHAGIGYKTYQWQDNSANEFFKVTVAGQYFVTVTDSCDNIFSDTINISYAPAIVFTVNNTASICSYDTAFIQLPPTLHNYTWNPSSLAQITSQNVLQLFPGSSTIFIVNGQAASGCVFSDTVLISSTICPTNFFLPSAFSPNNDNTNDTFKPILKGKVVHFEFYIYNRLGQIVFESHTPPKGWDGTYKNQPQDPATFTWYCRYKFKDEEAILKKGTVLLIR